MKHSRMLAMLAVVILVAAFLPLAVSANSAPPSFAYTFLLQELPVETKYVDLLIPLKENQDAYVPLNSANVPGTFCHDAQILTYYKDGYCSYTFHYLDAVSNIEVSLENQVEFFATNQLNFAKNGHREQIENMGTIRLAMLDEKGNILQVSRELVLRSRQVFATLTGSFRYNARTDTFDMSQETDPLYRFGYELIAFSLLVFTCILEYLISIPFGLWKYYGKMIVCVNVVSQILMHLLYILLYGLLFWRYAAAVLLLEVLVFAGECFYYTRKMDTEPVGKCILYGVIANAASLLVGLWVVCLL